jgi:N-acyl homoserine lactone hydrolase
MFMLEYGVERVPKSLSVLGRDAYIIRTPIYGALVETDDGLILLDTGISGLALADPDALTEIYGADLHPTGPPGNPMEVALASVGFTVGDVSLAVISHLHIDHTGGIAPLAAAGVPIAIMETEIEYGRQRAGQGTERAVGFYRQDYLDPSITWRPLSGDEQVAPGVFTVATPGHTPGHTSFRVDLPQSGTWILAADAADLGENLLERIPCGSVAEAEDAPRAIASINRLMDEGDRLDARVIPGHDAVFWKAVWHPADGHR